MSTTRQPATSQIQSLNRYAYVLNNPTTLIDPSGLGPQDADPCAYAPTRPACGGDAVHHGPSGSLFQDPFSLIGIPVVTNSFTPAEPISTPIESINNQYGEAVSATIYAPGGWTTTYVGDAFMLFDGSRAQPSSFSWWGTFAKSLIKNVPKTTWNSLTSSNGCLNQFFSNTVSNLNPFTPSASSLAEPTANFVSALKFNSALAYAATRPNVLGGTGLLYPFKSTVFRGC